MTCGPLLRRFKSTATALSTCGTPDAERGRRLRDVLASTPGSWSGSAGGAGLSDGHVGRADGSGGLPSCSGRPGAAHHHMIGCQCAASRPA